MDEKELRKIISEVLHENPMVTYIPDLAPYLLEKLDNAGYRKLSEDEYNKLILRKFKNVLYIEIDRARKKTAKEIAHLYGEYFEIGGQTLGDAIREQYGVEVEE